LDHLGLDAAVRSLCSDITRLHPVTVAYVRHAMPDSLPKAVALSLYRVTQEALHNVVKHSGAKDATVEIAGRAGMIIVNISDSGTGFDPDTQVAKAGLGLIGMRERVRQIGGVLSILSLPSRGTTIEVRVPLTASASSS
jgi:signal transduction histidine kinase